MNQRNHYFDNAKFHLIFLVVFGHFLKSYIEDNEIISTIYKVLYTFHMPAFILVSGFFAKGFYQKGYVKKLTQKLIIPYLIFQIIYSVFYYYLYDKREFTLDPFNPQWSLWFLISLFCWNLMLLIFAKYRTVVSITAALVIGLLAGYAEWISNYLSLSRTLMFFPFFLLGYFLRKEHLDSLCKIKLRLPATIVMMSVFVCMHFFQDINFKWFLGSKSYAELGGESVLALITRLVVYSVSTMMVVCFMVFVPKNQYWFTNLGKKTLYIYLLHGFFVRIFRESQIQYSFKYPEHFLLLAGISLLLMVLLSNKITTSLTQPLIELKISQLIILNIRMVSIFKFYRSKLVRKYNILKEQAKYL